MTTPSAKWQRFQKYYTEYPETGLALDISRMNFPDEFLSLMQQPAKNAFRDMARLEAGEIANPDENRMVGHYWLRNSSLAPTHFRTEIDQTLARIKEFASAVHDGKIHGTGGPFKNLLLVGIGGSALGPQFVANALGEHDTDHLCPYFLDNTDPDGIDRVLIRLDRELGQTLCVVVSKSGTTKETRNGMLEARGAYEHKGLEFAKHAVAVTMVGSAMDKTATDEGWLARFPMWDWVGGRTSELSAVGLLPAALQGLDIDGMLAGAKACDALTRTQDVMRNPSAQLALMWYYAGHGRGDKNMIVLPYKDRLELFSKYLQQLVMESLGKAQDKDGRLVHQGISVFGNKGSTDQHAYVQQLRDGRNDFFVVFIEVLRDRPGKSIEVEPGVTTGDYLNGFYQGTREALSQGGRESITITINEVNGFAVGVLIALFERTVGFYASLIQVNAYHQPGVEAGKKAATEVISTQLKVMEFLSKAQKAATAEEIAKAIGMPGSVGTIFKVCKHLAANADRKVAMKPGKSPTETRFSAA